MLKFFLKKKKKFQKFFQKFFYSKFFLKFFFFNKFFNLKKIFFWICIFEFAVNVSSI